MPRKTPARYVTRAQAIACFVTPEQAKEAAGKNEPFHWGKAFLKHVNDNPIFDAMGKLMLEDGKTIISCGGNRMNAKCAVVEVFKDPYPGQCDKNPDPKKPGAEKKPEATPANIVDATPKASEEDQSEEDQDESATDDPPPKAPTPDPKELDTLSVVYMGLDDGVTAAKRGGQYWQRRMADQDMIDFLAGKDAYVEALTHSLKDPEMSQKDTIITRAAIAATENLIADIRRKGSADPATDEKAAMREFAEANAALMPAIRDAVAEFRKQQERDAKAK